ncbi:hypothetical protein [Pararobbsia silviterrae]|nr:hypothetical protein [Pararobbsia silviterrae]
MTTSRHPTKRAPSDTTATQPLDEALEETFPASDPIAIPPDASEAQRKPRSATIKRDTRHAPSSRTRH